MLSSPRHKRGQEHRLVEAIGTISGVRRTRIEWTPEGPRSIRIVVSGERDQQAIVAEAREKLQELGVSVHPEQIEIIKFRHLKGADDLRKRARLAGLVTERHDEHFRARVTLELDGDLLVGESGGPAGRHFERYAVARAAYKSTLKAIDFEAELHTAEIVPIGGERVALVLLSGDGEILEGSALVKSDDHDAIARATLRALNRMTFGD